MALSTASASPVHPAALLPATGYLRQPQIIGKKPTANDPGLPALVPISATTLWAWVADGKFPKPVKLGPRVTAWRVEDVRGYLERMAARTPTAIPPSGHPNADA